MKHNTHNEVRSPDGNVRNADVRNADGKLVCRCLPAGIVEISRRGCTTTLLILPTTGTIYVTNVPPTHH
jgi:hypothetical protein